MAESSLHPKVILSANVSHYNHAAFALNEKGYLKLYITAISGRHGSILFSEFIPKFYRKKMINRDLTKLCKKQVRSIWFPELLQRALPSLGLLSAERVHWINNHLYDWLATFSVNDCDIFHFVSSIGLYSARKAKKQGSIIILDERQEHPNFQQRILREEYAKLGLPYDSNDVLLYDRKVKAEYEVADYFIVPSSYARETYIEAGIPSNKIFILPYGVDLSQFEFRGDKQIGGNDNTFRIIFSGQIVPRKGVHYLLETFEQLALDDSELILVGSLDRSMRVLVENAARKNPRIKIIGHVPKVDLYRFYTKSSVFVLPSLSDSYGLVSLEAMACGLPVIVTENTGSKEAVREGIDGFVVPTHNTDELANKLIYLYKNRDKCRQMGRHAFERVQDFTWAKYGERLINIYDGILSIGRS